MKNAVRFRLTRLLLGIWLLLGTCLLLVLLLAVFPEQVPGTNPSWRFSGMPAERGFLVLALLGGALGASLHAVQSFAVFVGNRSLRLSWAWWYLMRAPIGATLGALFYVAMRGGLMPGATNGVSPYGVVAIGGLSGLFSKKAVDKLQEVFEAMFRTKDADKYTDKLEESVLALASLAPSRVPVGAAALAVRLAGSGFVAGCVVELDGALLPTRFISASELEIEVDPQARTAGEEVKVVVIDPGPPERRSPALEIAFT